MREREQREVDGSLSFYLYRNTLWRGRKYVRAMRGTGDVRHGDKEVRAEAGGKLIEDNASPSCICPDRLH